MTPASLVHAAAIKLLRELPDAHSDEGEDCERATYEKLINYASMIPAWRALGRLANRIPIAGGEWSAEEVLAYTFLNESVAVTSKYSAIRRLSPSAHAAHYGHLADIAKELVDEIASDRALAEHVDHLTDFFDFGGLGHLLGARLNAIGVRVDAPTAELDNVAVGVALLAADKFPRVTDTLSHVAACARFIADRGPPIARPSEPTAARTYFIKHLSARLEELLGTTAHSVVAAAASTIFGEDVDPELVRKITSGRRKRPGRNGRSGTK